MIRLTVIAFKPVRCEKLLASIGQQAKTFDPTIVLGQQVQGLERARTA
ncbi:hypothetical protein WMW72_29520 [Paenibacillus filicis]|uniref:Uncharacterized protein n=1 Tax=Paenibacillus filicis TaxID=669464 RepID=A0ABU9DW99_9BACL